MTAMSRANNPVIGIVPTWQAGAAGRDGRDLQCFVTISYNLLLVRGDALR